MKTDTRQKILNFVEANGQITVQDLIGFLGHSPQAIHRQLKQLVQSQQLQKIGMPPRVFYQIDPTSQSKTSPKLTNDLVLLNKTGIVENNFVQILPNGTELVGTTAFKNWCDKRGFDLDQYVDKYNQIYNKYEIYKTQEGLIDATNKLTKTYATEVFLDKMFYLDFSAYEIFGKTKTYTHLLYAKLNEDKKLMFEIFESLNLKAKIGEFIQKNSIQAVSFVPPTVPRKTQFQTELKKYLQLALPHIEVYKLKTPILVPQKTLSLPEDRIVNSQTTFVVPQTIEVANILLIDDFAGSGATLNFIAQKLRQKNRVKNCQIYGLALCGTPNGVVDNSTKFEVVKEV